MGDVVTLKPPAIPGDDVSVERTTELLAIANGLDGYAGRLAAIAKKTEFPHWLNTLAGEVRKVSRACNGE